MNEVDVAAIEERAEQALAQVPAYIWDGESLPIPVDDIADSYFNLRICEVPPERMESLPDCPPLGENQSLSGLLLPSRGEIWVNAEEAGQWPPRRRFTICHELGHHVLHRSGQQSLFCRHGSVEEREPDSTRPPLPITEEEANAFAAALLMPARLMRHQYEFCDPENKFEQLCEIFGASGAAMGRRLHQVI